MRKIFALFIGFIGLGVVMSGCVANSFRDTKVKDSYIQKNYIDKVKVDKKKVVGDRNIKFYVGKVVDKRKDKKVWTKRMAFGIPTATVKFDNISKTVKNTTEKALYNTGWGVTNDKNKADFTIDTKISLFGKYASLLADTYKAKTDICVYKKIGNDDILSKEIYAKRAYVIFGEPDFSIRFRFVPAELDTLYYKALLDYFSSPAFVNAVKKAYAKLVDVKVSKK